MRKLPLRLVALLLAVALTFSGCSFLEELYRDVMGSLNAGLFTAFDDMEYLRPDLEELSRLAQECADLSAQTDDVEELMDAVYEFYYAYNGFYTNYALADLHYCHDLTDIYWEQEYAFCMENTARADALLDQLLYTLAACPLKEALEAEEYFGEGYFDGYAGESVWNEAFTALMEEESQLINQYYALSEKSLEEDTYSEAFFTGTGREMAELYAQLVLVRRKIATEAGYPSYVDFAYDFYYYRDYTPQQAKAYTEQIAKELVPIYRALDNNTDLHLNAGVFCSTSQTYSYVRDTANALGGTVLDAFLQLDSLGLYDIEHGENKYNASYEVYLTNYSVPFVFMNPTMYTRDQLTFVHEFGHFCNDFASGGSVAGIDVAEVFSQGMEYLSLKCVEGREKLTKLKMADCLAVYVEQAAYASFEQQVYALAPEEVTADKIIDLFDAVGRQFGFDSWDFDKRDFVTITHFFTNPMYVISYVVSNDAALQLYQMETEQAVKTLEDNLATEQAGFLAFLEEAGLESPFAPGRAESVKKLLQSILLDT